MENKTRKVVALSNLTPEETAFAIGRYSRSGKGITEVLKELETEKKASNFLQKFAVSYGHESLRDLATLTLAIEDVSMLAAIDLEHEQLWNGQERSTRYQDFSQPNFYTPDSLSGNDFYKNYMLDLFDLYTRMNAKLNELTDKPEFTREEILAKKAHIFDILRIILPYSTLTSVGQINSARSLQKQISRIQTSNFDELELIALDMQDAVSLNPSVTIEGEGEVQSPTLLKHVQPNAYRIKIEETVKEQLKPLFIGMTRDGRWPNATVERGLKAVPKYETVATLAYRYCSYSYNQILKSIPKYLTPTEVSVIYNSILDLRGQYDEVPVEYRTGQEYIFDIVSDGKTLQDLYRHRRCLQIRQDITDENNFNNIYGQFKNSGIDSIISLNIPEMNELINEVNRFLLMGSHYYGMFSQTVGTKEAAYALPMGYNRRSLFKMDAAEATYIIETRSQTQGHFNYRNISQQMYDIIQTTEPDLANNIRLVPFSKGDFLKR